MIFKALYTVPVFVLALTVLSPATGHAQDRWDRRDDDRGNRGHDGGRDFRRNDGPDLRGPVYFNGYRPRVVTRFVPYEPPVAYYYQRPPVVRYRDVVYYDDMPRYRVGDRLDGFHSVPRSVLVQLDRPPAGYYYSMGRHDVFLVSNRTNAIAQIISLFLQ